MELLYSLQKKGNTKDNRSFWDLEIIDSYLAILFWPLYWMMWKANGFELGLNQKGGPDIITSSSAM